MLFVPWRQRVVAWSNGILAPNSPITTLDGQFATTLVLQHLRCLIYGIAFLTPPVPVQWLEGSASTKQPPLTHPGWRIGEFWAMGSG